MVYYNYRKEREVKTMTLTVIKAIAHTDLFGDVAQTFYSMEELNRYADNKYVNSVTIIREEVIQ